MYNMILLSFLHYNIVDLCPKKIHVAYNTEWQPYVRITDGHLSGDDINFIKINLSDSYFTIEFVLTPEGRALEQLKQGKIDAVFAASYNKTRASYAHFSVHYRSEITSIVFHSINLVTMEYLKNPSQFYAHAGNYWIGAINNSGYYGEAFENFKKNKPHRLLHVNDDRRRLNMVAENRADFAVVDKKSAEWTIRDNASLGKLRISEFNLYKSDIHIIFSKKTINEECFNYLNTKIKNGLNKK